MFCFVTQETVAVATRENGLSIVQILISFNFTVKNFYRETFSGTNFHEARDFCFLALDASKPSSSHLTALAPSAQFLGHIR